MDPDRCPVCGTQAEIGNPGARDAIGVQCPRCGPFVLTGTAAAMLPSRLEADPKAVARASHAIRSRTSEKSWLEIDSTLVDELVSQPLPSPERQVANLIAWLKRQAGDAYTSSIPVGDRNALTAIVGAPDAGALEHVLRWATKDGLIEMAAWGPQVTLTREAWEEARDTEAKRAEMAQPEKKTDGVRGHCPRCGPDRRADVCADHTERYDDDQVGIWSIDTYRILKCRGCDTVYIQHENLFSENEDYEQDPATGEYQPFIRPTVTYWPAPARRRRPEWFDELKDDGLRDILGEVYSALDADQRVLAAIGTRTALDRAMVLKGATDALGFAEKLDELVDAGVISQTEKDILVALTDAGSAAAHRGWRPTPEMLTTIMDGMEAFLHRGLILGDAVTAMKGKVPPRPKRPKRVKGTKKSS